MPIINPQIALLEATRRLPTVSAPLTHLMRRRRRRGHGVHSPYVYHLITDVLYNQHPFYCFETLAHLEPDNKAAHRLGRLLFRLAVDAGHRQIRYIGSNGSPDLAYLAMTNRHVKAFACDEEALCRTMNLIGHLQGLSVDLVPAYEVETLSKVLLDEPPLDLIVLRPYPDPATNRHALLACMSHCHAGSMVVVMQATQKSMVSCWSEVKASERVTAVVEARDYGLLLFRPDLEKKCYSL